MAENFGTVFLRLRNIMLEAAPGTTIAKDAPGTLELRTKKVDLKTKQQEWFGTGTIKKAYVAYHLMPLYNQPKLGDDISPGLAKRKQGKTCFNVTRTDEQLFSELSCLTSVCAALVDE